MNSRVEFRTTIIPVLSDALISVETGAKYAIDHVTSVVAVYSHSDEQDPQIDVYAEVNTWCLEHEDATEAVLVEHSIRDAEGNEFASDTLVRLFSQAIELLIAENSLIGMELNVPRENDSLEDRCAAFLRCMGHHGIADNPKELRTLMGRFYEEYSEYTTGYTLADRIAAHVESVTSAN